MASARARVVARKVGMYPEGSPCVFRFEALIVGQVPNFALYRGEIAKAASAARLPTMTPQTIYAEAGCLLSYSTKPEPVYRTFARYVNRVLNGEKPGDLPVQQASDFELALNLTTAKELGITVAQSFLARVDKLIE